MCSRENDQCSTHRRKKSPAAWINRLSRDENRGGNDEYSADSGCEITESVTLPLRLHLGQEGADPKLPHPRDRQIKSFLDGYQSAQGQNERQPDTDWDENRQPQSPLKRDEKQHRPDNIKLL